MVFFSLWYLWSSFEGKQKEIEDIVNVNIKRLVDLR